MKQRTQKQIPETFRSPKVYGWDDGNVYFSNGGKEVRINDFPGLFEKIIKTVDKYFSGQIKK